MDLIIILSGLTFFGFINWKEMIFHAIKECGIVSSLYSKHYMLPPMIIRKFYKLHPERIPCFCCIALGYLLWMLLSLPFYILAILIAKADFSISRILLYLWLFSKLFLIIVFFSFYFYFIKKRQKQRQDTISARNTSKH